MPGPGFLGEYEFVFIKEELSGITSRVSVIVKIKPKFEK
jgi:hypothetical protein